jgi:hypothetical protein
MARDEGMGKKIAGAFFTLALFALVWVLCGLGSAPAAATHGVAPTEPATRTATKKEFHSRDRMGAVETKTAGTCTECHPLAVHTKNQRVRAFLNAHTLLLDCSACHTKSVGLQLRRWDKDGRIHAGNLSGGDFKLFAKHEDATIVKAAPSCRECHSRGSGFLSTPGLYDEYRRRLLEDLAVFAIMEGVRE